MGEKLASKSESLKSPRQDYNTDGEKLAWIYLRKGDLYFVGGGEWKEGGITSGHPIFKISNDSLTNEKGEAIIKVLSGFSVGLDGEEASKEIRKTGMNVQETELSKLSGLKSISNFYHKTPKCGLTEYKDKNTIKILPMKKGRGYYYTGLGEKMIETPKDDLEALGKALDEAFERCIA